MSSPPTHLSDQRKEFYHGIFTTALEGGIGYWSQCSKYHWCLDLNADTYEDDLDGFYAVIHPVEDGWGMFGDPAGTVGDCPEDRAPLTIDLSIIHAGARRLAWYVQGLIDNKGKPVPLENVDPLPDNHYWWQYVAAYNSNGQHGDYDAEVADAVVQFGLFGEVVYG